MDVLTIERLDGSIFRVNLRRLDVWPEESTPEWAEKDYGALKLVESAGIPAPRPLHLDTAGELFGCPSIASTYLPGRPWMPTEDSHRWTAGLAEAAFAIHSVTPERFDLSRLNVQPRDGMRNRIDGFRERVRGNKLAAEVYKALARNLDRIELLPPTLVHGDFWAGNTIWSRRRLTGIIDWAEAFVGDPRADIGECRGDLNMSHGPEAANRFSDDYERLTGTPIRDLWFFDLYVGINALLNYKLWLQGYHDLGLRRLTVAVAGKRLRIFVRRALDEAT